MAAPTLSIGVSRRAMLAGGAAVPALALTAVPALASPPAVGMPGLDLTPDARLFRRIAVAERLRGRHARAVRLLDRLRAAQGEDHAEQIWISLYARRWSAADRAGRPEAMLRSRALFRRYAAAVRGAVATPAHTLPGLHAKLALAVIAARRGDARIYLYEDRGWLETVLADLERLTDSGFRPVQDPGRPPGWP